jgi:hypothetical protein
VSFHVTVNLKYLIDCRLDPVNSWNCEFISGQDIFTRLSRDWLG